MSDNSSKYDMLVTYSLMEKRLEKHIYALKKPQNNVHTVVESGQFKGFSILI